MNLRLPVRVCMPRVALERGDFEALFPGTVSGGPAPTVTLVGPRGRSQPLPVEINPRGGSAVRITRTIAEQTGIAAPVRLPDDIAGSPGGTLAAGARSRALDAGVIVRRRRVMLSPAEAHAARLSDGDLVYVTPLRETGARDAIVFGNVVVLIRAGAAATLYLDTDEAHAAGLATGDPCTVVSPAPRTAATTLITENDVRRAVLEKRRITLRPGMRLTPAARDLGRHRHVLD